MPQHELNKYSTAALIAMERGAVKASVKNTEDQTTPRKIDWGMDVITS